MQNYANTKTQTKSWALTYVLTFLLCIGLIWGLMALTGNHMNSAISKLDAPTYPYQPQSDRYDLK